MLKPLIIVLILVSLLALALNFNLFNTQTNTISPTINVTKAPSTVEVYSKDVEHSEPQKKLEVKNNEVDISIELKKLIAEASKLFQKGEDAEALRLYDLIIEQSQNSTDPKILELFSDACFSKAYIYNIYPNNDIDSALEEYDKIINKFKNKEDKSLLLLYMRARLQSAQYTSKDEILNAYDELIKKFKTDKDKRFKKEVEQMLFSKSFALMGVNDEEAMDVLDDIISAYQGKGVKELPETVQFSILNNIELSIITNNNDEKYVDLANKYLSNSADTKPLLEMLNIIKNSQDLNQDDALKNWHEEHSDYHFPDWDFNELKKWASSMENKEQRLRVFEYINDFERQKYNRKHTDPYAQISPERNNDEGQNSGNENSTVESYEATNEPETEYEPIEYEPDPYIDDIYNNDAYQPSYPSPEVVYDNPYLHLNADGVSHVYQGPEIK
jgi:hypothetical protein